jgi:hypothetical protein
MWYGKVILFPTYWRTFRALSRPVAGVLLTGATAQPAGAVACPDEQRRWQQPPTHAERHPGRHPAHFVLPVGEPPDARGGSGAATVVVVDRKGNLAWLLVCRTVREGKGWQGRTGKA